MKNENKCANCGKFQTAESGFIALDPMNENEHMIVCGEKCADYAAEKINESRFDIIPFYRQRIGVQYQTHSRVNERTGLFHAVQNLVDRFGTFVCCAFDYDQYSNDELIVAMYFDKVPGDSNTTWREYALGPHF